MKNIFKIFIALVLISGLWSCTNEENFKILAPQEAAFAIITPDTGSSILLNKATPSNTALTLTWEKVTYGTPTAITYTVQFAVNGTDFTAPIDISSSGSTNFSMNVVNLNAKALELGFAPDVESAIDVRIKSTVGTIGSEEKFSNSITILVTPYNTIIPKREMFLVGDATAAGWSENNNNVPLFRDPANDNKYSYTGYFAAGQVKLLEIKGKWQPQWGTKNGALAVNDGTGTDPDSFVIATAGYYTLSINVTDLTYSLIPFTGSTATTYVTIGLVGDASPGGWDTSTPMTKSTFDPHIWKVTANLSNGKLKFRANDAWTVNWGSGTAFSGVGTQDGSNIPVSSATYDVWFNDLDGSYLLIPIL
ncbi:MULTISPECIES: SusE domain-containing protein [unclassified Flavobacterium]|jgi:uncharacterized surface protein with fasciclin (FAS1) repeats|uniref:SusE domain-containing protein n=1 Tax=unclassified Flavobacterium TaxID=196869 RepID=UPI0025B8E7A0|nr:MULTISPECIES: SusE domain-containing protein [unclassified Flavobacterium]